MIDGGDFSSSGVAEYFTTFNTISKKNKYRNKMRRFSDEQVKSLENIFETESTLEPRKKLQVARELGLQPRQVAIWFQNKRARWKSKQLERDYSVLLANYNTLSSQFETLKEEKKSLLLQLQKLNDLLEKSKEGIECCREPLEREKSSDGIPNHGAYHIKSEFEEKPSLTLPEVSEQRFVALSDDDDDSSIRGRAEYLVLDVLGKPDLVNMVEQPDSSLTSPEDWGSFVSDDLLYLTPSSYKWWDFCS